MPNIYDFDSLYRRTATGLGEDSQTVRVYLGRVPPAHFRVLTHVSVENETDSFDSLRIGIENGSVRYYLDEIAEPAQAELIVSRSDILLGEGDRFFAEFDSANTGDRLVLTAIGWTKALTKK